MPATPPSTTKSGDVDTSSTRLTGDQANDAVAGAQCPEHERQDAHDATLARALQAKEEAAAAAKDRDVAAQRASDALARTTKERAAATAIATPGSSGTVLGGAPAPTADLHTAMLLHEAVALLQLHGQAVAVNNIQNHVTIILDVNSGNFNCWRDQFMLILGKFSL